MAISLTRAGESRYATGELLATLTHVARLRAALSLECRRRRRVRAKIERIDVEQVALRRAHGQPATEKRSDDEGCEAMS